MYNIPIVLIWLNIASVVDPEGGNPAMPPIQFGYRLWLLFNETINMTYWETY